MTSICILAALSEPGGQAEDRFAKRRGSQRSHIEKICQESITDL